MSLSRTAAALKALSATALAFALGASCASGGDGSANAADSGNPSASSSGGGSSGAHDGGGQDATASSSSGADSGSSGSGDGPPMDAACASPSTYDQMVLCDDPVALWAMNKTSGGEPSEPDLTGNGNTGSYMGGAPPLVALPNGDQAADFDGSTCRPTPGGPQGAVMCAYLTVPSKPSLSIPTTGNLTWEAWIRPDVLQFPHDDVARTGGSGGSGYVDWMGKCDSYSPTCEWEARLYDTTTKESPNRPNRMSAYVFNPTASLGSGADWQPMPGVVQSAQWYHVVGEYTTKTQPADCPVAPAYPGSIDIWVNGVPWSQSHHNPTGCMSQYNVVPTANASAVNIGTMAFDTWFQGAIGKVAIYDLLLTQTQITSHYAKMTGMQPTGSCADSCTL